jgi:hypothetical protein
VESREAVEIALCVCGKDVYTRRNSRCPTSSSSSQYSSMENAAGQLGRLGRALGACAAAATALVVPPPLPLANTDAGPSHEPAASSVDAGASSSLRTTSSLTTPAVCCCSRVGSHPILQLNNKQKGHSGCSYYFHGQSNSSFFPSVDDRI